MTTGEVIVHEVELRDGAAGEDEPFLRERRGNAFETRVGEVVCLSASAAGLASLTAKVKRLVDGGLHALVVSLAGVEVVPEPKKALASLLQAARLLEQFGGWMVVADAAPELVSALRALPGGTDVPFVPDRAAALEEYRRHAARPENGNGDGDDPLAGVRSDQLPIRPREILPQPRSNDWGWTVDPESDEAQLPQVEVAELFVEEGELPDLLPSVKQAIARGRRHVTLRIQFQRGVGPGTGRRTGRGEELAALTEARDLLEREGGQLVLAGLQSGFQGWLDSIGGFRIVESADEAEKLHRLHAAGQLPAEPAREAAFRILTQARDRLTLRPREVEATAPAETTTRRVKLLRVDAGALARLSRRVQALPREGIEAVVVDLRALAIDDGVRGEPLVDAALAAVAAGLELACCEVNPELRAWLRLHGMEEALLHESLERAGLHLAARLHAREPFQELCLELSREDLVETSERERAPDVVDAASRVAADRPVTAPAPPLPLPATLQAPAVAAPGSDELRQLREEAARLRSERDVAERARGELEQALRRAERHQLETEQVLLKTERRLAEHERAATVARAEAESLRDQLQTARRERDEARAAGTDGRVREAEERAAAELTALKQRVAQLERDKARILTEAEQEIERLTREQEALREELESAGEMIERLGKELEHS